MELKVIRLANGCIFPWYGNISDVYVLISPTISKHKRIPRFFWEWSRMRKQSIPGRLSPPTWPGYEASPDCALVKTSMNSQSLGDREMLRGWKFWEPILLRLFNNTPEAKRPRAWLVLFLEICFQYSGRSNPGEEIGFWNFYESNLYCFPPSLFDRPIEK